MQTGYTKDIILAVVFFLYPFFLLMVSKSLDRTGVRKDFSRKLVHSGMGIVILFIPYFDRLWIALIPPIVFTLVNAIDLKWGVFSQIQGEDRGNVGTVLYPISYIILMSACFHTRWWGLAVLGILAMAFGDAGASIIGRQFGKRQ
jgi:dolichol kinase